MSNANSISQSRLRELFDYRDGNLIWRKKTRRRTIVGQIAGTELRNGYIKIGIDKGQYLAHRLIWVWHYGEIAKEMVDHINGVKNDNRIENLRLASRSENNTNSVPCKRNKSGLKGVCFDSNRGLWVASITKDKRQKMLGRYATKELAYAAYVAAANSLHGEFVRHH